MSIEVRVLEVLGLTDRLRATADLGLEAAARVGAPGAAGPVTVALGDFLGCFGLAARALGEQTGLLADAAETAACSWLALDEGMLARRGLLMFR